MGCAWRKHTCPSSLTCNGVWALATQTKPSIPSARNRYKIRPKHRHRTRLGRIDNGLVLVEQCLELIIVQVAGDFEAVVGLVAGFLVRSTGRSLGTTRTWHHATINSSARDTGWALTDLMGTNGRTAAARIVHQTCSSRARTAGNHLALLAGSQV